MADGSGLVEKIKRAALDAQESQKPVNVCFGKVVSRDPLKINVEQKLLLGEKQLVLTRNVTDFYTRITVDWKTELKGGGSGEASYEEHKHDIRGKKQILVHNRLEVGDEVILIRQQEGQKFIVIDRIGGKG